MATTGGPTSLRACFYVISTVFISRIWAQTATGPSNLTGKVGDTPIFSCSGNPSDSVTWSFFNPTLVKLWSSPNTMFADGSKYSVKASDGGTYSLMVNNAALSDAGTYSCDRSSAASHLYANLVIIETPQADVLPPITASSGVKSYGMKVGDVAQLTCRVQYGAPTRQSQFINPVDGGPQDPQFKMYLGDDDLTSKAAVQNQCTPNTPLCYKILSVNYTIEANYHNGTSTRQPFGGLSSTQSTASSTASFSTTTTSTTTMSFMSSSSSSLWNQTNLSSSSSETLHMPGPFPSNNSTTSSWTDLSKHPDSMGHIQRRLYCEIMTANAAFFDASSAAVDVSSPVTRVWMEHPDDIPHTIGHRDYCFADGFPVPKVSWTPVYDNLTATDGQTSNYGNASLTPSIAGRHRWNCTASNELNSIIIFRVYEFDVFGDNSTEGEAKGGDDSVGLGVGLGLGLGIPILLALVILVCILMKRRKRSETLIKKEVPPAYVATVPNKSTAPIYKAPTNKAPQTKNGPPNNFVNLNPDPTSVPLLRGEPAGGPLGRNSPGFGDLGAKQISGTVPMLDESFNSNANRSYDHDRAQPEAAARSSNGSSGYPSSSERHRSDL